jgi:hypothetical protein
MTQILALADPRRDGYPNHKFQQGQPVISKDSGNIYTVAYPIMMANGTHGYCVADRSGAEQFLFEDSLKALRVEEPHLFAIEGGAGRETPDAKKQRLLAEIIALAEACDFDGGNAA